MHSSTSISASPSSPRNSRVQTSFRGCRPRFSMTNSLLCVWVVYCVPKSITSNLPCTSVDIAWTGERTWTKTWEQTGKNRGKNITAIINQNNQRPKSKSRRFLQVSIKVGGEFSPNTSKYTHSSYCSCFTEEFHQESRKPIPPSPAIPGHRQGTIHDTSREFQCPWPSR